MNTIIVHVDGGVVQDIEGIPPGIEVHVRDYDTDWADPGQCPVNEHGRAYYLAVYTAEWQWRSTEEAR
jgi:hypothetical protein